MNGFMKSSNKNHIVLLLGKEKENFFEQMNYWKFDNGVPVRKINEEWI